MTEFGHIWMRGPGFCIDSWGAGPFVITHAGGTYRFEDSDRFGPYMIKKNGDPTTRQPGEHSPFWAAWHSWKSQGRQTAEDDVTCIYDPTLTAST